MSDETFPPRPHPSPRKCGVVQVWSVESRARLCRMETFGDLTQVAFSADGKLVAASRLFETSDKLQLNEVRVWEIGTGSVAISFDRCHAFSFSPQGSAIAVASRTRCVVYDLTTGNKLKQLPSLAGAITLRYSPEGTRLAGIVRASEGFKIRICDAADPHNQLVSTVLMQPFYSVTFSPNGRYLASGHTGGNVLLWDADPLQPAARLNSGGQGLQHPFFSPDGTLLGAGDQANGDVVFWNMTNNEEVTRYTFKSGSFHTYRLRSQEDRVAPEKDPARFVFSPDGQSFLSGPHGGIIRLISTGQDTHQFGD